MSNYGPCPCTYDDNLIPSLQAEMYRSKLMKTMAQRRLQVCHLDTFFLQCLANVWCVVVVISQSEVESLTEASFKTGGEPIFTPYLIPDANSLCTGLHIVKKLVKTEKFIFIITKAGAYKISVHYLGVVLVAMECQGPTRRGKLTSSITSC